MMSLARSALVATVLCAATLWPADGRAAPASPDEVYDGRGTLVGTVLPDASDPSARYGLDAGELIWVAHTVDGVPVRMLVGPDGPWDTKDLEPLRYASEDCTGNGLLAAATAPDEPRPALTFDTMVFLPAGAARPLVVRSVGWPQRAGAACSAEQVSPLFCCARLARPETVSATPVAVVDLASLELSPPFRVVAPGRSAR
jgi:hypothetical protein